MTTTENSDVKTESIPASAKAELAAALRSKTARRTFRSVEEVVADGVKAGEKEPADAKAAAEAAIEAEIKAEPLALPETIDIVIDDETGKRTEVFKSRDGSEITEPIKETKVEETLEPIKEKVTGPKIKIGTKTFDNQDEAIAYAEELERQTLTDEAFRQGIEAASQIAPSNSVSAGDVKTSESETVPDIYYTNPAAYLKQRDEILAARVKADLKAESAVQERNRATWTKFWSDYPDLATSDKTKNLVEVVYQQNFQRLAKVKTEVALKEIAGLTRDWMKELGVTILPTKTLPSTTKTVVSSGSSHAPSRPKPVEKNLSWVEEMKSIKRKKAEARQRR